MQTVEETRDRSSRCQVPSCVLERRLVCITRGFPPTLISISPFVHRIDNCKGPWNFIPTKELAEYTMHRIIAAALLLDRLQALLMKAYV